MSKAILFILIAVSILSGCASLNPPPAAQPARNAPPSLMLECLPPEAPENATMGALLESYIETATRLNTCRTRHKALTEWARYE